MVFNAWWSQVCEWKRWEHLKLSVVLECIEHDLQRQWWEGSVLVLGVSMLPYIWIRTEYAYQVWKERTNRQTYDILCKEKRWK
jgi:hypothetical protein